MNHEIESSSEILKSTMIDEQEMQEITQFFSQVESLKNKIFLQLNKQEIMKSDDKIHLLPKEEIINLLLQNMNLVNIISEDTINIYVESFFKKNEEGKFQMTEDSLEGFLTSIMIFSNNE